MTTAILTRPATLTFDRAAMLEALTVAGTVAPIRSPKPILAQVKLAVDANGTAELLATDLEVGLRLRVLGVQCDGSASLLLNPVRLRSILATSDDEQVYLSIDGDKMVIRTRRSEFRLPSEDPELFPDVPTFDATDYHELKGDDLGRLIKRTAYATDPNSSRYALGGCLIEPGDDTMTFVATDGRRLAKQVVPAIRYGEGIPQGVPAVVPLKALKLIARIVDGEEAVSVAVTDKAMTVRAGAATIHSRLVEGRFPRYADVFPSDAATKIHFPETLALRLAFEQASIVTSEESRGVDVAIEGGVLRLSSQAADVGSSTIDLPVDYEGEKLETCFDPRYCTDLLKTLDGSESLAMELISPKHPAVFRNETGMISCIMPLSKDR